MSDSSYNQTLSDGQEMAISILFVISSTLSIIGSSAIIYKVISDRLNATAYDRMLLGLSVCDVISSIAFGLSPFLLPKETSIRVWAIGSDSSCSFLGFMTQFGFSSVLYNGFLSFYYLLTVRYGVKRPRFAKRYEPWFHGVAILFPLITAVVGAFMGFYSELQLGVGCWVNDYPRGCASGTGDDTCISEEIAWFYGSSPVVFTLFSLIINNTLVYFHVRKVFKTANVSASDRSIRHQIHQREVATQGLFYVGTFFVCFWSAIAVRVMEGFSETPVNESDVYWLLVIMSATLPLQGFLNVFVYTRPNYHRVRAAYPHLSRFAAIRKACLDPYIPKLTEISTPSGGSFRSLGNNKRRAPPASSFASNLHRIEEEKEDGGDNDLSGMDGELQTPGSSSEMEKWGSAFPLNDFGPSPTDVEDDPQDQNDGPHDHDDHIDDKESLDGPPSVLRFPRMRIEMDGLISEISTS